ncbi:MAG: hypothetical protein AAF628_20035 [Planctomycetota bacterium]
MTAPHPLRRPFASVAWAAVLAVTTATAQETSAPPVPAPTVPAPAVPAPTAAAAPEGETAPAATDVEALLAQMRRAHGLEEQRTFESFVGALRFMPRGQGADSVSVDLEVRFRQPRRIRYRFVEDGRVLERGLDRLGMWARLNADGPPRSLGGPDFQDDRAQVKREIGLARQLLHFLDPVALVRAFDAPPEIGEATLPFSRGKTKKCLTITGEVAEFPLYLAGGASHRAHLKLWVDAASYQLTAVQCLPLGDQGRVVYPGEFLLFPKHVAWHGILLPGVLAVHRVHQGAPKEPVVDVTVLQADLGVELDDAAFDRDADW